MLRKVLLLLFLGAVIAYPNPDPSKTTSQHSIHLPTITTPLGDINGTIITSRLGKPIYSFKGIRYAKAPVKDLRFQPPVPVEKWENTLNASTDPPLCPQADKQASEISEDCLFLNVYTTKLPKGNENPKRSVLVFFHHGEFYSHSATSNELGPHYLLDQDIVLVVPNYRLGTLGFLSTGDKEAPGNNGLKDQVLALKWVKENIASFGGNPEAVTIAGYCAGAASVSLHLVSPLSKGLFDRAIVMSGSVYGNWPLQNNQLDLAKKQAKLVECPDDTSTNIVSCLKTKPVEDLVKSIPGFKEFGADPAYHWSPVIEQDFGQERFLTAHPIELVLKDEFEKVPILAGITADEFGGRAFDIGFNKTLLADLDKDFERIAPIIFMYERNTDKSKEISKALKTFYFKDKPFDDTVIPALAQLFSDALVGFNVNRFVEVLSQKLEQIFYYKFSYSGRYSFFYSPYSNTGTRPYGASHMDDLKYLFYFPVFPMFKDADSNVQMVEKMTKMWSNFVTLGVPIKEPCDLLDNVKWDPYTTKTQSYMVIGNKLALSEKLLEERYTEWKKLYPLSQYEDPKMG